MAIQKFEIGSGQLRRPAPSPVVPVAEPLVGEDAGLDLGAALITVPAKGGMPLHDHGPSDALLFPTAGRLQVIDEQEQVVEADAGSVVTIPKGEKVKVENPADDEVSMLVVFSPSGFMAAVEQWPTVD